METKSNAAPKVCVVGSSLHDRHDLGGHPENKGRIDHIWDVLRSGELLREVTELNARPLTEDELALVHDRHYVRWLQELTPTGHLLIDRDTYIGPDTYEAAVWSAGCAVRGLEAIMQGECQHAFALCRPPGHHAFKDMAMGFCFFNNVALAARIAQVRFGLTRVAIVDWDVHHGNGTQEIFYDDPTVLFISMHQHPHYPSTGLAHETGSGQGEGFTVNIPLAASATDSNYLDCIRETVLPKLNAFQPQLIIVSAGQDALAEDPLGGMDLTPLVYAAMTRELLRVAKQHAEGRMLLCLEGGYHLVQQAQAVRAIIEALVE